MVSSLLLVLSIEHLNFGQQNNSRLCVSNGIPLLSILAEQLQFLSDDTSNLVPRLPFYVTEVTNCPRAYLITNCIKRWNNLKQNDMDTPDRILLSYCCKYSIASNKWLKAVLYAVLHMHLIHKIQWCRPNCNASSSLLLSTHEIQRIK